MSRPSTARVQPEWLRWCAALDALDYDEIAAITALAEVEDFDAGEQVFAQGSAGDKLYVIVSGRVEAIRSGQVIAKLIAGEFFGEMAMFNRSERVATVRTLEATRLVALGERRFRPLVQRQEPAAVKLIQQLGALTLKRMQRANEDMRKRMAEDDPLLGMVLDEYRQLSGELLAGWALAYHAVGKPGKLTVTSIKPSSTAADLAVAYSPGVAEPCSAIASDAEAAYAYTGKGRLVAVVSNGTAVLGLGAIGALAAKPVMEGKAVLFKRFADLDAFDIEVDETDPRGMVDTVVRIAPTFGGINLEDIAAPDCFWIEEECKRRLDIPVMHDDQHGTAIIVGAALLNALELVGKRIDEVRVVFAGAGAAGFATARYLADLGVRRERMILTDDKGVVHAAREMPPYLREFAIDTGLRTLAEAVAGGDVFVGLSAANVLTEDMLRSMAPNGIVGARDRPANRTRNPAGCHRRHGTQRLPQPGQQRAGVSLRLPRRTRHPRPRDHACHEARRHPGDRPPRPAADHSRGRLRRRRPRIRARLPDPQAVRPPPAARGGHRCGRGRDARRRCAHCPRPRRVPDRAHRGRRGPAVSSWLVRRTGI